MSRASASQSQKSYDFGICTVSLGSWKHHGLENKLRQAAKAGYRGIDLFDEDWAQHLKSCGLDPDTPWEPSPANLKCAKELGELVKSLGMYIICTQPMRSVEGIKDNIERAESIRMVTNRFPFMRAFDTDLTFLCSNVRTDSGVTADFQTIVRELQDISDLATVYSHRDGGKMLKIGYEGLSWARRNTWSTTWEIVRAVNRPNFGLILDSFNMLAVEFADPYAKDGHGMLYPTREEALDVLCSSLASLVATVPAEKIFFVQLADAQLMDPRTFFPPTDSETPRLLPWSRMCRLFPMEQHLGSYLPIDLVTAAVIATGYSGPLSLEVFMRSLHQTHFSVPEEHAVRGMKSMKVLLEAVNKVPKFWTAVAQPMSIRWGAKILTNSNHTISGTDDMESRL